MHLKQYILTNVKSNNNCINSPDFEKPFVLQTDVSDRGLGAVLSQKDDNGSDHLVADYSRKLQPREERNSPPKKKSVLL